MSKILVNTPCCLPTSIDHYEMMRGETRILHNIGFGLAWIGHDVNIVNSFSDNIVINGLDNGKVCLSKSPIDSKYDYEMSWGHFVNSFNDPSCKCICMISYPYEIGIKENVDYSTRFNGRFVTPFGNLVESLNSIGNIKVEYLPPLFSIPTYRLGFKEYSGFDINNLINVLGNRDIVNIFVYISSWEKYLPGILESTLIIEHLKKRFANVGKRIKLYIGIDSENTLKDVAYISKLGDEVEYVYKCRYDKYLEMIEKMDMFVIRGSSAHTTAGMYDIISLGKPMLYVAWESYIGDNITIRNPLHMRPENIIYMAEDYKSILNKVDKFLNDTKGFYEVFRECVKDSDFNNWKVIVKGIFG